MFVNTLRKIGSTNWFDEFKKFYGGLIDLVGFVVDKTTNQGADIAIRALPIVSPLPNAISMYYVSQQALGFGDWQAKAFAAAIELALFGLFEVAINMFDGYLKDRESYKYLFALATSVAVGVMILIIWVVYKVEVAHPILAVLPLFSAAGALALVLRRWNVRHLAALALKSETIRRTEQTSPIAISETTPIKIKPAKRTVEPARSGDKGEELLAILKGMDGQPAEVFKKSEIARKLGIKPGTLRYHLGRLETSGAVTLNGTIQINETHQ